jgi:zinc protease
MTAIPPVANALPGPENITRRKFKNGLTVLAHNNPESLSVVVTGYLMAGALYDLDEKLGLSHFTSLALMRGTHSRSFQKIYSGLENIGASMNFGAGTHSVSFSSHALVEDLPFLLCLLSEVLNSPSFPSRYIEKLRTLIITGLTIRAQDTGEMSSLVFDRLLFAGHPYERPEDGYVETINAISRKDLIDFHACHFGPRGGVVVITGPLESAHACDLLEQTFGDWQNPSQPVVPKLPRLKPLTGTHRQHTAIPGKSQVDLVMGTHGPSRLSEDYYAAMVGNTILGQFGMMGRIGASVRERSGLAYYAYSGLNAGIGPGSWEFSAGVNPANLEQAIHLICSEINCFISKTVSREELSDVKANLIGRLPLAFESNAGMASALINLERYRLGLDYYQRYQGIINAVTREDILETGRKYLHPDEMVISTAGSLETQSLIEQELTTP